MLNHNSERLALCWWPLHYQIRCHLYLIQLDWADYGVIELSHLRSTCTIREILFLIFWGNLWGRVITIGAFRLHHKMTAALLNTTLESLSLRKLEKSVFYLELSKPGSAYQLTRKSNHGRIGKPFRGNCCIISSWAFLPCQISWVLAITLKVRVPVSRFIPRPVVVRQTAVLCRAILWGTLRYIESLFLYFTFCIEPFCRRYLFNQECRSRQLVSDTVTVDWPGKVGNCDSSYTDKEDQK